jgi:putative hydrolase of the HAD superfamily
MPPLRAVTLDAAGTLITVAEPVGQTYARVAARHGLHVSPGEAEAGFRRALATQAPLAFPHSHAAERRDRERAWWYAVVRGALGATTGDGLEAACGELFEHYADPGAWRVFPEVPRVLEALRAGGVLLAVVSNFDGRLVPLLGALGISQRIDVVVHSSEAGSAKPDPAIFLEAVSRLRVSPADALHVGDDPAADVAGARRAGLAAALVDRNLDRRLDRHWDRHGTGPAVPEGVPVLRSLDELPGLADAL